MALLFLCADNLGDKKKVKPVAKRSGTLWVFSVAKR
jgi:hypothetical protein